MTDNTSSIYPMTQAIQSTLVASGTELPALRSLIPCMAQVIRLDVAVFISSLGVIRHSKSWEAHECDQKCGENESPDIGKCPRRRKEGDATISKVSAMRPGWAKIIKKAHISRHLESPATDLHIAANACCIDYPDTWSSKWVHCLSNTQCTNRSITNYGWENWIKFDNRGG